MFVGVAVDDDVGAVWLAIDANTSAHTNNNTTTTNNTTNNTNNTTNNTTTCKTRFSIRERRAAKT
jgi:hypothetical protein